jgi:uncharacterized protein (TIGR03083 family)
MTALTFDRRCVEIVAQTDMLTGYLDCADITVPVPSCPGWNVSQLLRHVEADTAGPPRSSRPLRPNRHPTRRRVTSPDMPTRPAALAASLTQAAAHLAATLQQAGPDAQMWCPVGDGGTRFYARRFTHETAIHRADAALGLGVPFTLATDVAVDGVDEWLELGCLPFHFKIHPWMRELLGPGRTIGLRAADTGTAWLLDLTGDAIAWRRSDEPAAAEITAPVIDLLLMLYRRRPVAGLDVTGDAGLVDFWLERVAFG